MPKINSQESLQCYRSIYPLWVVKTPDYDLSLNTYTSYMETCHYLSCTRKGKGYLPFPMTNVLEAIWISKWAIHFRTGNKYHAVRTSRKTEKHNNITTRMYKIYCSYSELHNITSFFFYSWHLSAFVFLASKWKHDITLKIRIVFVNPPKQIERELLIIKDYSRGNIASHTDQELSYIAIWGEI